MRKTSAASAIRKLICSSPDPAHFFRASPKNKSGPHRVLCGIAKVLKKISVRAWTAGRGEPADRLSSALVGPRELQARYRRCSGPKPGQPLQGVAARGVGDLRLGENAPIAQAVHVVDARAIREVGAEQDLRRRDDRSQR